MPRFVLITGRMGSGKSAVSDLLRKKHYKVIDTDSEVKKYYEDPDVFKFIVNTFGKGILDENGSIDKWKILQVYKRKDKTECNALSAILISKLIEQLSAIQKQEVIFVEGALIREIGWFVHALSINKILYVDSSDELRYKRISKRESYADLLELDSMQCKDNLYNYYCGEDHINFGNLGDSFSVHLIENNGSIEELNDKIMDFLEKDLKLDFIEKLEMYRRYLGESPSYCAENSWCYSFYNTGGCNSCPFPCKNQNKYFDKQKEVNDGKIHPVV
ncbi:MAG: dephospho-CoA kinase [Methanobrevibacter sp.]|nr:dephospho-CoA kinase [Methanobrevibacter sp.]